MEILKSSVAVINFMMGIIMASDRRELWKKKFSNQARCSILNEDLGKSLILPLYILNFVVTP